MKKQHLQLQCYKNSVTKKHPHIGKKNNDIFFSLIITITITIAIAIAIRRIGIKKYINYGVGGGLFSNASILINLIFRKRR